jgi:hypothetical protein
MFWLANWRANSRPGLYEAVPFTGRDQGAMGASRNRITPDTYRGHCDRRHGRWPISWRSTRPWQLGGVSRPTVIGWRSRYERSGLAGHQLPHHLLIAVRKTAIAITKYTTHRDYSPFVKARRLTVPPVPPPLITLGVALALSQLCTVAEVASPKRDL